MNPLPTTESTTYQKNWNDSRCRICNQQLNLPYQNALIFSRWVLTKTEKTNPLWWNQWDWKLTIWLIQYYWGYIQHHSLIHIQSKQLGFNENWKREILSTLFGSGRCQKNENTGNGVVISNHDRKTPAAANWDTAVSPHFISLGLCTHRGDPHCSSLFIGSCVDTLYMTDLGFGTVVVTWQTNCKEKNSNVFCIQAKIENNNAFSYLSYFIKIWI